MLLNAEYLPPSTLPRDLRLGCTQGPRPRRMIWDHGGVDYVGRYARFAKENEAVMTDEDRRNPSTQFVLENGAAAWDKPAAWPGWLARVALEGRMKWDDDGQMYVLPPTGKPVVPDYELQRECLDRFLGVGKW
jgi:hypothetical protein